MLTLRKLENVPTGPNNRPKLAVKITGMFVPELFMIELNCLFDVENVVKCKVSKHRRI
jgi:peptidyl-prolyl isomerase H (cyclophilin H)